MPRDLREALADASKAKTAWEALTPLAKNEWICWVTSVKKAETRAYHIKRLANEIVEGKRRPCCFAGCIHRDGAAKRYAEERAKNKK